VRGRQVGAAPGGDEAISTVFSATVAAAITRAIDTASATNSGVKSIYAAYKMSIKFCCQSASEPAS